MYYKSRCALGYAFEASVTAAVQTAASLTWIKQHAGADYNISDIAYVEIKTAATPVMKLDNLSYDQIMQMMDKPCESWVIATSKGLSGCRLIWFPRLMKGDPVILPRMTELTIDQAIRHIEYQIRRRNLNATYI